MSRRILLHVGTPKTGTSYLQDVLFRNREVLAKAGVLYPAERFDAHFLAALDLMRMPWGGLEAEAVGAWDDLAARVREWDRTAIISHEIFATASRSQIRRAFESLGHGSAEEPAFHVLLSVRDLVRQIPAEWQENVKHRATLSYASFLEQIRDPERSGRIATWFWGVQEIPEILERWGQLVPPERIHLITVPPGGAPADELWRRFSAAFDLDDIELDLHTERANPSLGVPETALIRRINRRVNAILEPADYRPLVRELLAHQTLSTRRDSARLGLPPEMHPWVVDLARSWIEELRQRGYGVVGDLDDLLGAAPSEFVDPDTPRVREINQAGMDAIAALLLESAERRRITDVQHERLVELEAALERAYLRPTYRLREKTVNALESSRAGRLLMRVYRLLRGRSSLSP